MKSLSRHLSKKDCLQILELIDASLRCNNEEAFRPLINCLSQLIPFDHAICGMSKLSSEGHIASFQILNFNYPSDWLKLYISRRYDRIDPIVRENYVRYGLQYWADTYSKHEQEKEFIANARDYRLNDGYTIGMKDSNNRGSIFTLSGFSMQRCCRTEMILNRLLPHFHQVMTRLNGSLGAQKHDLSDREIEVLNWLKHGKTSWDVSKILNISERTVNFHCTSVVQKLDAVSRSHALAIAIDRGIVSLD